MIVVDTSALVLGLSDPQNEAASHIRNSDDLHAPHLIDVEFLHTVRRLLANGDVNEVEADHLVRALKQIPITRYPHHPLISDIWSLRNNLTPYDACFVSLATRLDLKLLTADKKMANAPNTGIDFILVKN